VVRIFAPLRGEIVVDGEALGLRGNDAEVGKPANLDGPADLDGPAEVGEPEAGEPEAGEAEVAGRLEPEAAPGADL
jgi:hypothetical protein